MKGESKNDDGVLVYAHIGDLHLTTADADNARDLAAIVAELSALGAGLDFVFVPGDNADDGRPEQYALARRLLAPLPVPVHVITGDHDMEGGSLDAFYAGLGADRLPKALDAGGVRCLFLDICGAGDGGPDFRLGAGQHAWLGAELRTAAAAGRRCAIFMHSYPADLRGDGETQAINEALAAREVLLVDMGHTHYNELANDGRTIFAATRSTGQIEEGPVGYSLVTIDGRCVSWRFRPLGLEGPVVLITAPADRRLATDADDGSHAPRGTACAVRATVLAPRTVVACTCSVDGAAPVAMRAVGPHRWITEMVLPAEARRLRVEAQAEDGTVGSETIEIADAAHFAAARRADGSDADAVGAWPERGILGTQLGPNRNGKKW